MPEDRLSSALCRSDDQRACAACLKETGSMQIRKKIQEVSELLYLFHMPGQSLHCDPGLPGKGPGDLLCSADGCRILRALHSADLRSGSAVCIVPADSVYHHECDGDPDRVSSGHVVSDDSDECGCTSEMGFHRRSCKHGSQADGNESAAEECQ